MREIKFNFYDTINQKYIRWGESNAGMSMSAFITHEYLKFLQYTGLKDKNGREIYEGDIVNVNKYGGTPRLEQVQFYTTGSGFAAIHPFQDDGYHWSANYCEVIGNIYEHPHLLEGGSE